MDTKKPKEDLCDYEFGKLTLNDRNVLFRRMDTGLTIYEWIEKLAIRYEVKNIQLDTAQLLHEITYAIKDQQKS